MSWFDKDGRRIRCIYVISREFDDALSDLQSDDRAVSLSNHRIDLGVL